MVILIVILILEFWLLTRILKYFLLSPTYLYVIFSLTTILFSIVYFYFYDNKISLFNLDSVSSPIFLQTIKSYIIALVSFIAGVLISYDLTTKKKRTIFLQPFSNVLFVKYRVNYKHVLTAKWLFIGIILMYIITYGKGILWRDTYLPETNKSLTTLIKILSFLDVILFALVYKDYKRISLFYFIGLLLISISTGSRAVFIFLLIYILILFISQGNTLKNKVYFSLNLFISLIFLAYLMQLRSLPSHGLLPYLASILDTNFSSFKDNFIFNIYYSLIYGVFVTIKTVQLSKIDWNIIFISLNPLPGSLTGWYDYADKMRVNIYVPYTLHGRVFKTGVMFTTIYFFINGIIFFYFEKKVRSYFNQGKRLLGITITLILILYIIFSFEYNMRAAFRYIYYAYFFIFINAILSYILPYLPKRTKKNG